MTMIGKCLQDLRDNRYSDFIKGLQNFERPDGERPLFRVAILRSYTVEPIEPLIRYFSLLDGVDASVFIGRFNQYAQDVLDPSSDFNQFDPDLVLFMVRPEDLFPDFFESKSNCAAEKWRETLKESADNIGKLASQVIKQHNCQVLIQNAPVNANPAPALFEAQNVDGTATLLQEFNTALANSIAATTGTFVWDFNSLVFRLGYQQIFDSRMWFLSRNPYRLSAFPYLAFDLQRHIRAAKGQVKKCIVLDLDNTLWGGIIGEDGMSGIQIGQVYPGNCFRAFQLRLLEFQRQGMILAINSKNNETDAFDALEHHPDMALRKSDFSCWRINWQDKASNLVEIAAELNIGLDSMVMVDDNPVECELIRQRLPEVDVYCLPEQPHQLVDFVDDIVGLERLSVTEEDRSKSTQYRAQAERNSAKADFASLDEFLGSLDLKISIERATDFQIPRVAQLTQKTNQFNLTTRRYTDTQIADFVEDASTQVLAITVEDRFGDYGVVGVAVLKFDQDTCAIDSFLLSCRVIGRGVEDAMVAWIAKEALDGGANILCGEFIPTAKNQPAASLFERLGFENRDETRYFADLRESKFEMPPYIAIEKRQ